MEIRLSAVLSEFARTLVTDFPIQQILDRLVGRIVDVLPVDAVGVTLISPGIEPRYVAASDESALRFERLQTELGEGPCIGAYTSGESVSVPDLRKDQHYPRFSARGLEEGLAAVFTLPLNAADKRLGALDLYRKQVGDLDSATMEAAQTLADVAAAYLLNAQARDDLRESSERAVQSSLHDALTGLPNRPLLVQRLEHAMLRSRRSKKILAILFADLDGFKAVNDTFGHHMGDELLVGVAERLTGILRPGDTLARLGGDEFIIMCEDLDDASQVDPVATRIGSALAEPFRLTGGEVQVSASVGIAFAGRGQDIPEQVLQDADTAMYQAKRKGGGRHGIVDLREQHLSNRRANLSSDLRGALSRAELRIEYQPIVSVADASVIGVEALLRWDHPTLGLIAPEMAVPLAELSGVITAIGRWVLEQACLDRHRWRPDERLGQLDIAVNVSANQLMSPDYVETVHAVLTETRTDPSVVTLEVTESIFIQDSERAVVVLEDLKALGVMLALDDFGTGYSSLSYLKRFPVDIVKIDRSFVADLGRDPSGRIIVQAIIGLAHGLKTKVVAEGVETADQYRQVAALSCDAYQGFYFARPARADDLDELLAGGVDMSHLLAPIARLS